jgi:hypothetical protein
MSSVKRRAQGWRRGKFESQSRTEADRNHSTIEVSKSGHLDDKITNYKKQNPANKPS